MVGPSPSNLYDGARDDHNLHFDVHVWGRIKDMGPTTKNLWPTHMAQLKINYDKVREES